MNDHCVESASELARRLARGDCSSVELVRAHFDRIDRIDGRIRAFTQVFHHRALIEAEQADRERAKGEIRGPLHGIPITVKESIDLEGYAATMGLPSRRDVVAHADGVLVKMLRQGGAIVLGRTNVSQALLFAESRNPMFGETSNPWSLAHSPGGSSGGEAAALAAGMSPLGIGTDIGGSIRIPAHFCGIAGLKPTLDRWSNRGSNTALRGQETVRAQIGPMARTVADLRMFMESLDPARMTLLDPRVPPVERRLARIEVAPLRIGVVGDDGLIPVSRSVARAVHRASALLAARGCQIRPFVVPRSGEMVFEYLRALSSDGGRAASRLLEGGAVDPVLRRLRRASGLPSAIRRMTARATEMAGEHRLAALVSSLGELPVDELWQLTDVLRRYQFEVLDAMVIAGVDVLLAPPYATPALPHGMSKNFVLASSHAMIWNVVQFPAGVVPVTRVRAEEVERSGPRDRLEKQAADVDHKSVGLPLGVQVVGRPWRDDVVLSVMEAIEDDAVLDDSFPRVPCALR